MNGKFLATVGEHPPAILCETHAQAFELAFTVNQIPHTILELEDDDGPYYCHACDLQVAKAYVQRVQAADTPKIVLPGEF